MIHSISPTDILTDDEKFVNDSLESTLKRAEKLQNSSDALRTFLVRHLISEQRAEQAHYVATCGSYLVFKRYRNAERTLTLERANFCKHPMCPVCAWRRHLKYSKILDRALEIGTYRYIYHVVLGVPNVDELDKTDLMRLKERGATFVKQKLAGVGYISNLEVVCHGNGIHPHLHLLVETEQFIRNSADYVREMSHKWMMHYVRGLENKADFIERYQGFTFFLTGITRDQRQGVAQELTKYIVKGDFTNDDGTHVATVASAIKGVRKMSSAGSFKKAITKAKGELICESAERLESLSRSEYELFIYRYINGKYEKENLR